MENIRIVTGNLFSSKLQALVNTVNCVGVMGAGIALGFRLRFPTMYEAYKEACSLNKVRVGALWPYRVDDRLLLNFPTKQHWKDESKIPYLIAGLQTFVRTYRHLGVTSAAFPLLGANNGGIPAARSEQIMIEYLSKCEIPIEIYRFDPNAPDEIVNPMREVFKSSRWEERTRSIGIKGPQARALKEALADDSIVNIGQLSIVEGIGIRTIERAVNECRGRHK